MIRQYRIDRYQGLEFLVCEVYFRHTWTQDEVKAYQLYFEDIKKRFDLEPTQASFRTDLDEWLENEHSIGETYYGLSQPIPAIETIPHIVLRGAVIKNRVVSLNVDYMDSVTTLEVMDNIQRFYDFVKSPHWRNTVLSQISNYGSLFGSDND